MHGFLGIMFLNYPLCSFNQLGGEAAEGSLCTVHTVIEYLQQWNE